MLALLLYILTQRYAIIAIFSLVYRHNVTEIPTLDVGILYHAHSLNGNL